MNEDPIAHLDFETAEPEVIDLTSLTDYELSALYSRVRRAIMELGEMFTQPQDRSERGKELHSQFAAINIEKLRRRW